MTYLDQNVRADALASREGQVHRRGARHHADVRVLRGCGLCVGDVTQQRKGVHADRRVSQMCSTCVRCVA